MKNEAHDGVVTGRARRLILPLALAALLGGYNVCLAQVPGPGAVKTPAQPPPATASESSAASSEYIIGPGDTLKITVLRNPELNAEVPVRPDGKISTPLVNDAVAVGKTPTQLAQEIEKVVGEQNQLVNFRWRKPLRFLYLHDQKIDLERRSGIELCILFDQPSIHEKVKSIDPTVLSASY